MRVSCGLTQGYHLQSGRLESGQNLTISTFPRRSGPASRYCSSWTKTINTERFHKRVRLKREQHSTPCSKGLEHDPPDGLGCRMKCPKNAVGNPWVGMDPSCACNNPIAAEIAAVRMNAKIRGPLAQQTGIVTGLDETHRTVQTLVPKSAYRSVRGTISL